MDHFQLWKSFLLAAVLLLCSWRLYSDASIATNATYYQQQNATGPSTSTSTATGSRRHYALLNGTNTIMTDVKLSDVESRPASGVEPIQIGGAAETTAQESHLTRSSVVFGLTKVVNESNVNMICQSQMKHIQRSILSKQPWAMKVLDASGTKPSGFVFGQNYWLGSREACKAVQRPVGITLSKNYERVMHYSLITENAPFDMDYRVVYLRHNSPWQVEIKLMSEQIIHIGLCLPSACASAEIKQLTTDYVARGMFAENDIFDISPEVVYMKDLKLQATFFQRSTFKLIVACVIITSALMVLAQQLRERDTMAVAPAKAKHVPTQHAVEHADGLPSAETELWRFFDAVLDDPQRLRGLKDFIRCFDVQSNWSRVFAMRTVTSNEIPVINGLRSVCAIWIMIFHVMWFMYFTVHNKTVLISYAEQVFFQYISSAPLLVDVFFTISGFLQTYNFLRNAKQMEMVRQNTFGQNLQHFGKLLFHRYLRLGPLYLLIIGVVDLLYAYIGDMSVYHINERFDEMCAKHWWRNIFFIQNLYDHRDMCVNWSWSLACEMQFFILATILLFIYAKHPRFARRMVVGSLLATIVWSYAIGINTKFQLSFDVAFATGTQIYVSPFVRVLPYIMGAMAAWCLHEKKFQYELSESQEKFCWNLALLTFFVCLYSTIKRDLGYLVSISLFVLGRFAFSLSICWMIVGSATGRASWWSRLLEAKGFQHVNRLTYAIYLLNPMVIAFFYSLTSASTHADPFMLCVVTSGFSVIVYLASIVFTLAFEFPYSNLSSLLLKRNKSKCA